jgi:hypothetical protein
MGALASAAGVLPEFLAARWPKERRPLEALALEAEEVREREREDLANKIRTEMADLLDKSMPSR